MDSSQHVLIAFATFMADVLVQNGLVPPPQSPKEADSLIKLVILKFDEFVAMMTQVQGAVNSDASSGELN